MGEGESDCAFPCILSLSIQTGEWKGIGSLHPLIPVWHCLAQRDLVE